MFTPVKGEPYIKPTITIHGSCLDVVESFTYLGSTLTCDGSLDAEIHRCIQKASVAYGRLEKRLWSNTGITHKTKLNVYKSCVLSVLSYSSETWTLFRRHLKTLEHFHQKCLRRILNIKWNSNTPNTEVLSRVGCSRIETLIITAQMRWAGHAVCMSDVRMPKQLLYGQLHDG